MQEISVSLVRDLENFMHAVLHQFSQMDIKLSKLIDYCDHTGEAQDTQDLPEEEELD